MWFGLAIVAALVVGAFGATLIYKHYDEKQATTMVGAGAPSDSGISESQLVAGAGASISGSPLPPAPENKSATSSIPKTSLQDPPRVSVAKAVRAPVNPQPELVDVLDEKQLRPGDDIHEDSCSDRASDKVEASLSKAW